MGITIGDKSSHFQQKIHFLATTSSILLFYIIASHQLHIGEMKTCFYIYMRDDVYIKIDFFKQQLSLCMGVYFWQIFIGKGEIKLRFNVLFEKLAISIHNLAPLFRQENGEEISNLSDLYHCTHMSYQCFIIISKDRHQ